MPNSTVVAIAEALEPLTHMQRLYVEARLQGMSKIAAATAAGCANPQKNAYKIDQAASVQLALKACREATALSISFGVKEAYDMYIQAYLTAATSAEMTKATDSLVKLFGIAKPEVKEIYQHHTGKIDHHKIAELSDSELARMARFKPGEDPHTVDGEALDITVPQLEHDGD